MFILENIRLAFGALINNKMRSLLTMLGIIIGISSVITITTIGTSLKTTLANAFMSSGNNGFYLVYEVKFNDDYSYVEATKDDYCTEEMLNELAQKFEDKYLICQEKYLGAGTIRNSKNQLLNVGLEGFSEGEMLVSKGTLWLTCGRYLNDEDSNQLKHACVVSDIFVQQYFQDGSDPIGKSISIDISGICNTEFVIVGVYKYPPSVEKQIAPGTSLMDRNTMIYVPYRVSLKLTNQAPDSDSIQHPQINVREQNFNLEACKQELQEFFDEQFENNKALYVSVHSYQEDMKQTNMILTIITVVISVIAAISLLVGGIGVMNIMLVSITERTREIGVRKAIGAKSTTIRNQFLIEAIIMCLTGGGIGILLGIINGLLVGIIGTKLLHHFFPLYADLVTINIKPSLLAVTVSVAFSVLIGLFFGTYPASKAAKMNPIDALRYE